MHRVPSVYSLSTLYGENLSFEQVQSDLYVYVLMLYIQTHYRI